MDEKLELSPEEMRTLGYRVVDLIADHFSRMSEKPVGAKGDPAVLRPALLGPPPVQPVPAEEILARLERDIFPNTMNICHPRFFAFVPGPSNFVSVMADALASGFNVFNGSWLGGSAAAAMELAVIDWFRVWCGFPEDSGWIIRQRRIDGEPDSAGCGATREAEGPRRRSRHLLFRPDAFVDRSRAAGDRVSAGTDPPDSFGRRISPSGRRAGSLVSRRIAPRACGLSR